VKATDPPNGPASAAFWSLATQTFSAPPTEPEQVIPAGIWIATGKSMVEAAERPPIPIPGTFWVTSAVLKAAGSVPPDVASTMAVNGPAPSWLTWWKFMVTVPSSAAVGRPSEAPAPAAALTPVSVVPLGVLIPPLAARAPRDRLLIMASWISRAATVSVLLASPPMKRAIIFEASTGPVDVRPRAVALLVPISLVRMMEVSASDPQPGVGQSRGVPSATGKC
jgi:hypothetical protein